MPEKTVLLLDGGFVKKKIQAKDKERFVPPMKFARKEGMRVYLECLGHPVKRELKAHADFIL